MIFCIHGKHISLPVGTNVGTNRRLLPTAPEMQLSVIISFARFRAIQGCK